MDLLQQVRQTVRRYRMLPPGLRVGVAVSGGADSLCLLHVLRELADSQEWRLSVLHVNHRLRGRESEADEEFVCALARRFRLPFFVCHAGAVGSSGNLEQAARRTRLHYFRRLIESGRVDRVADGHTRSDQAETVLFRFLRGAGTAGLAGIRPVTNWGLARPLLEVQRGTVESYLRTAKIEWRDDSSNTNLRFARNRIRRELLPQLARDWNPAIVEVLAGTAEWARGEDEYWGIEVERLAADLLVMQDGAVVVAVRALAGRPEAVLRRLVRRAIELVKGGLEAVNFRHVQEIVELISSPCATGKSQAPGVTVERSFDWVRFAQTCGGLAAEDYSIEVTVPGIVKNIVVELVEKTETSEPSCNVYNGGTGCLDWPRLSGVLRLRNWRAGDRYQPLGSSGEKRIKTLFQNARIPVWERRGWPVLMDGDSIVWSRRFGPAAEFAAKSGSAVVLRVRDAIG